MKGRPQPCYWDLVDALYEDFADHRLTPKGVGWPAGLNYPGGVAYDCAGGLDPYSWGIWGFDSLAGFGGMVSGFALVIWLFVLHRLAGPRIRWRAGGRIAVAGVAFAALMLVVQSRDPRAWGRVGPESGERYFFPSLARTATGDSVSGVEFAADEATEQPADQPSSEPTDAPSVPALSRALSRHVRAVSA